MWNENTNLQSCRQLLCPTMPNAFKYKSSHLADVKLGRKLIMHSLLGQIQALWQQGHPPETLLPS